MHTKHKIQKKNWNIKNVYILTKTNSTNIKEKSILIQIFKGH
jgi:hypothetical protein